RGRLLKRAKAINPRIQSELYARSEPVPFMDEAARVNAQLAQFADNAVARVSGAHPRKAI
ncbi:alpha/beta hydrolase, partial [Cronobacter sakazakii]|nr:alpha/beta hydrolase [Cronobacter sakazakii]